MLDNIIRILFYWEKLRNAIFAEVDWHNSITKTLNDPDSMKTASIFWYEVDGWRGWTNNSDQSYYFHDIAENNLSDIIDIITKKNN